LVVVVEVVEEWPRERGKKEGRKKLIFIILGFFVEK
jgi:hypothetical protein